MALAGAYMEDSCRRQARNPRPTLRCKDARKGNWLTQVDLLGSDAISVRDVLDGIQPEVIAAGLHKHPACSGRRCAWERLRPASKQPLTFDPAGKPIQA